MVGTDKVEVMFKVKTTTRLGKLMDAYAHQTGSDKTSLRFVYDGLKLRSDHYL